MEYITVYWYTIRLDVRTILHTYSDIEWYRIDVDTYDASMSCIDHFRFTIGADYARGTHTDEDICHYIVDGDWPQETITKQMYGLRLHDTIDRHQNHIKLTYDQTGHMYIQFKESICYSANMIGVLLNAVEQHITALRGAIAN